MNFLNFLTSGAGSNFSSNSVFNFNLQNPTLNNTSNSLLRNLTLPIPTKTPINDRTEELSEDQASKEVPDPANLIERIVANSQTELLTHQQQLINQYMHLNIQLLSKKIESLENVPEKKEDSSLTEIKSNKKKMYLFAKKRKK
jgi:hypothetical protein